ncbi:MAG: superoxide dismutase [Proteobacteria bacterium]|nr:superoxide dismutase [Pseudomonadota bacterium]
MRQLNRRAFGAALLATASSAVAPRVWAQAPAGPFQLPPLGYAFNSLEPHVDAKTMEIHHDKHHAAYVANLNAALKDYGQLAALPLEQILGKLGEVPEAVRTIVRNNGGGHANHSMFWSIMGSPGTAPEGDVKAAIERDFGGLDKLQEQFNAAGLKVFGSGWVQVTAGADGKLAIVSKPNQDTPLMEGQRVLFGNDVWEHAYYLNYQNRRADYLKAWWNVVNWKAVAARYAAAKEGKLAI